MTKIAIIRCEEKAKICPGTTCFKVMQDKSAAFEKYDKIEIVGFDTCGGCGLGKTEKIAAKAQALKERGAEVIHVSSCVKSKCPWYASFVQEVGKHTDVADHTH